MPNVIHQEKYSAQQFGYDFRNLTREKHPSTRPEKTVEKSDSLSWEKTQSGPRVSSDPRRQPETPYAACNTINGKSMAALPCDRFADIAAQHFA